MKRFLLLILLALTIHSMYAQRIKGRVVDESRNPIDAAQARLQSQDSSLVTRVECDFRGRFYIALENEITADSVFSLTISAMGFAPVTIHLNGALKEDINLKDITLHPAELGEVTVTAKRIIDKTDRRLVFPSQIMTEHSANGYELLNRLTLPGIRVDVLNKSVSSISGGDVPLYINEKPASKADVVALRPDEIVYVEHIDNPGVQYGINAPDNVINFVVKRRYAGFMAGVDATNGVTSGKGNDWAYAKYNYKLSEFGVSYYIDYSDMMKRHVDEETNYSFANNRLVELKREGINTSLKYTQQYVQLSYNLSVPEKMVFEADLNGNFYDSSHRGQLQHMRETGKPNYYAYSEPTEMYHAPSLSLFFKAMLPHQQRFTVSSVGTYIDSKYGYRYSTYSSYNNKQLDGALSSFGYDTKGKKYSFIGEARYNKTFKKTELVVGLIQSAAHTRNIYSGDNPTTTKMNDASTYLYAGLNGNINTLSYMVGAGVNYKQYKQQGDKYGYWMFRPTTTLTWKPFEGFTARYAFNLVPTTPSLASLSNVRQQANEYEYRVGNPNLNPYSSFRNNLTLSYGNNLLYLRNITQYNYHHKPIMQSVDYRTSTTATDYWDISSANQRRFEQFSNYLAAALFLLDGQLTFQGGLIYDYYHSVGTNYEHRHNSLAIQLQADYIMGNWEFGAKWNTRSGELWGETINYDASYSRLYVTYAWKNMRFGLYGSYLFKKDQLVDEERLISSSLQRSLRVYTPSYGNLISISFSWNFSTGRKYNAEEKDFSHSDNDNGIFKM